MPAFSEKVTSALGAAASAAAPAKLLDVVVELAWKSQPAPESNLSREESLTVLEKAFLREAEPVERSIRELGGDVTARAWINRTLRAKVPARSLDGVASLEGVERLDVPHPLKAEGGG